MLQPHGWPGVAVRTALSIPEVQCEKSSEEEQQAVLAGVAFPFPISPGHNHPGAGGDVDLHLSMLWSSFADFGSVLNGKALNCQGAFV